MIAIQTMSPTSPSLLWRRVILGFLLLCYQCSFTRATDYAFPNTTLTRLAFGSCHKNKYANKTHSIWKTIQEQTDPQLWLWMGDTVYPPSKKVASVESLRVEYQRLKEDVSIGYSSFKPPLGTFGTWDDHDYGANDAGKEVPEKDARAALFWDLLGQTKPDPSRQGVYSSLTIGLPPHQVKIIILDTRWHRDTHCIPSVATKMPLGAGFACLTRWMVAGLLPKWCNSSEATVLGGEQWKWLENELLTKDEAPALTLVVSSVQVLTTNPSMEGWGHFPAERDRLIRLLATVADRTTLFVLSGDVHHAEILDPMPTKDDSFLEVTSSGLTHDCSDHIYGMMCRPILETFRYHRYDNPANYYIGKNYGSVVVDWNQSIVEIRVHDDSGRIVLSTGPHTLRTPHSSWTEKEFEFVHACQDGHLLVWLKTLLVAIFVGVFFIGFSPHYWLAPR